MEANRYKNLLDPIKDLASNWDIDIADELANYLDELADLQITIDGGASALNFAEAALVISGSTLIYSKKVEYLHQLVMKSLELLAVQKAQAQSASEQSTSGKQKSVNISIAEDERILFTDDLDNLLVDNMLTEADNIDLQEVPEESSRKHINSLLAHKNNDSRTDSRNTALMMNSLLQDDNGGCLRMSSCRIDQSGMLTLGNLPAIDSSALSQHRKMNETSDNELIDCDERLPYNDYGDDYNDNYTAQEMSHSNDQVLNDAKKANEDNYFIRSNLNRESRVRQPKLMQQKSPPLDPHELSKDSKPLKKSVCYRIPKVLKQNGNDPIASKPTDALMTYLKRQVAEKDFFSSKQLHNWAIFEEKRIHIPTTGLLTSAFSNIEKQIRKANRKLKTIDSDENIAEDDFLYRDPVEDHEYEQSLSANRIRNFPSSSTKEVPVPNDCDAIGGQDYYPVDNWNGDNCNQNPINPIDNELNRDNEYLDNIDIDDEDAQLARRVDKILSDELESTLRSSYKMICDKMIMDFKRGIEKYARETQLSRRVNDWTNRMEPILNAQDKAPPYDIHDYSDRIISKMHRIIHSTVMKKKHVVKDKDVVNFDDIIIHREHNSQEVCRVFLACLQLANCGNVLIIPPAKEPFHGHTDSFCMQLLDASKKIDIENHFPVSQS